MASIQSLRSCSVSAENYKYPLSYLHSVSVCLFVYQLVCSNQQLSDFMSICKLRRPMLVYISSLCRGPKCVILFRLPIYLIVPLSPPVLYSLNSRTIENRFMGVLSENHGEFTYCKVMNHQTIYDMIGHLLFLLVLFTLLSIETVHFEGLLPT